MVLKIVGWVDAAVTQQSLDNVGFRYRSTQPTLIHYSIGAFGDEISISVPNDVGLR